MNENSSSRLADRVIFITGASRGVGKAVALACAREGADIVVAAKTADHHARLPGTIHETAEAVRELGRRALALQLDVRDEAACEQAVAKAIDEFGRVDALVNNAGALWWADVADTPVKRYDLIMSVNVRASFVLSHALLPHMLERGFGHILMMSPPVDMEAVAHHGAYAVSKFGMTILAKSIWEEYGERNVSAHALWPATAIDSEATRHFGLGNESMWRKPDILADATLALLAAQPKTRGGQAWIDEDLLRSEGVADFAKYRCDPEQEPPKLDLRHIPALSREP